MDISINRLIDYYGNAPVMFGDAFKQTLQPGTRGAERMTAAGYSGLVFLLEGKARFIFNGTAYEIEPGIVLHAGPDMLLSKEATGDHACTYIIVHYYIPADTGREASLQRDHFRFGLSSCKRSLELAQDLLACYETPGDMAALRTKVLFVKLIYEMIVSAKRKFQDRDSETIGQAVEYINDHYAEKISVEQLAAQFGYDQRRFTYLFERDVGMRPMNYVTDLRIRRSREMLKSSACPVSHVAEWVGYSDSFYFSRQFKKYMGMSPTEFRKRG